MGGSKDEQRFTRQKNTDISKSLNKHMQNEIAFCHWGQLGSNLV